MELKHWWWCRLFGWFMGRREWVHIAPKWTTRKCTFCGRAIREHTPKMEPLSVDRIMELNDQVTAEEKRFLRENWEK